MAIENEENEINQNDDIFGDFDITSFSSFIEEKTNSTGQSSLEVETDQTGSVEEIQQNQQEENEDPSSQNTGQDSPSLYTAIAKVLVEEGVLQELKEGTKIEGAEDLIKLYDDQIQARVEQYKQGLDPRVKWLQDHIEEGVALEDLLALDKSKIEVNQIAESNLDSDENLQKQVLRQFYQKTTKFSNERIEKEITRLSDLNELENEAKSALPELKQVIADEENILAEKAKKEREAQLEAQTKQLESFKKTLNETKEIIPGLALTSTLKDKVYKSMTTAVAQDAFGNPVNRIGKARMENPLDFEFKLAYLYELTDGFTKWDVLATPAKKTAMKELETAAMKLDLQKTTGNPISKREKESSKDILKAMDAFGF